MLSASRPSWENERGLGHLASAASRMVRGAQAEAALVGRSAVRPGEASLRSSGYWDAGLPGRGRLHAHQLQAQAAYPV
jgi:hypothetical protein